MAAGGVTSSRSGQLISAAGRDADIQLDYVGSTENAAKVIAALHQGEKRLVFCDSKQLVEQLGAPLRGRGVTTHLVQASLSLDERRRAARAFAEGRDCVIVATSALELGIDVGELDRVIQVNAPLTVAAFLQRLGRSGRRPGQVAGPHAAERFDEVRQADDRQMSAWWLPGLPARLPSMSLEVTAGQQEQLRALAHPVRVRILSLLTGHAMSSAELARELAMKHAAVSYHVRHLEKAGFLEVAETRTVRGGHERRYRYRAGTGGRDGRQWRGEDPQLVVRAVTGELIRRLAEGPSHWRAFADAELWVDPGVWEDVRERVRAAMIDLHSAAQPPRSAGSVHVSATAMLFEVDAEAPGPAPEGGPGGPQPAARTGAGRPDAGRLAGDGR